ESDSIYFYNAVFKIYGFPFFYLPYLKTVRPTVERKTGFSAPSYKNNNHFGYGIYVPYYIRISDNKNLTLTPLVYTKYWNYALETIYRHYLRGGEYNIIGSLANDKGASDDILLSNGLTRREERKDRDFGAYIQAIGAFELFNNWIVDFNGSLVSDEYYLRDYKNDYSDYLTHFINFQKVWQRNNLSIKALTFTEVNGSDREVNKTPVVLPMINSHVEGKTYNFVNKHIALRSELDSNFSVISRNEGLQYRRLTIKPNLYNSYIKWGNVIKFEMNLKSDFYSLDENYEEDDRDQIMEYDSFKSRFIPQAELEWSYPLARKGQIFNTRLLVEPIVKLISTPNSDYNNKYPNEDSKVTAISDSNLFSSNRFSGFDRVETGSRSAYGIKGGLYSADYGNFRFLIGQAYELKKDKNIEIRGFSDNFSDVVGGLSYSTDKIFDIYYRFRIDKVKYEARSHEVSSSFDFDYFDFGIDYTWLFPELDGDTEKEEITPSVGIKLPFNMHFNASITRDLFEEDVTISKNMELSYKGSCVFSSISLSEITPRDGSEKSRSITFNIKIQNQWL
ncbi:MAG: LPS-assembly protein LptD, partial [Candidatus Thorarchaeota archaeon]